MVSHRINTSIELLIKFNYTHNNGKFMRFLLAPFTLQKKTVAFFCCCLVEDITVQIKGGCFDGKINVHGSGKQTHIHT